MLWKSLNKFNIMLYMVFPPIPFPRERDQVIMEIIFSLDLIFNTVKSPNRCRGALKAIVLSDITTADGRSLSTSSSIQERKQARHITNFLWSNQQEKTGTIG
jgi:hypothetical protein